VDVLVEEARAHGRASELAFEVLSTLPYPLRRVLERHGLGRFRVTQKVDLANPDDVYRSENARPEDWVQLGNHDTRPIWAVAEGWVASGAGRAHAEHLATRLLADDEDRAAWTARVAADPAALVQARLAELFVGPARNVTIHFTDLFGAREPYNRPGVVAEENWSLRVPASPRAAFEARLAAGRALDLPRALARVLRSRGRAFAAAHAPLLRALEGEQE
jgi:4-alpha-glucanotransferase